MSDGWLGRDKDQTYMDLRVKVPRSIMVRLLAATEKLHRTRGLSMSEIVVKALDHELRHIEGSG